MHNNGEKNSSHKKGCRQKIINYYVMKSDLSITINNTNGNLTE